MNRVISKPAKNASGNSTRESKQYKTKGGASGRSFVNWYERPEGEAHEDLFQYVRDIKQRQMRRRYELAIFQQLYTNNLNSLVGPTSLFTNLFDNSNGANKLSVNVVKSCVDTATARIAKSKPRAFVLPTKGDYRLKKKCKNLTKFLDGAMSASGVYANSEDVFRDSCIYGDGALVLRPGDGEIVSESVKIDELIIDRVAGMYDKPQEMHIEHPVPRSQLLAKYPDKKRQIDESRLSWRGDLAFMSQQDMVLTVETWRMPSAPDAKDGRHILCINNCTLIDEPWTKSYIPIYRFHWTPPTYGPFGQGIAHELEGKQWMITNMLRDIAESIRMFAVPRVWVEAMSQVSQHTISNEISVNKYTGNAPTFSTPPAAAPDIYAFLQWLIDDCYKELGLSQLSAQSEKPAGLNSGVAMRTYQDVETQRFSIVGQRWERWFMAIAEGIVDMTADMHKAGKTVSVKVPGRGFIETIDWGDVSIKRDQYDVQIWPTNILPETPEGKLQAIQEWTSSGFMPRDVAIGQMNMPILNDWVDDETAARENIEMCLSSFLYREKPKYIAPDPVGNMDLCVTLAQSAKLRADLDDVEPHRVDLIQRFLTRALELQAQSKAPPPGAPPGPGGPAVGQAPPPPVAPLAPAGSGAVTLPTAA